MASTGPHADPADGATLPADVARRLRELETLYESLRTITSTLDLGALVRRVLDAISLLPEWWASMLEPRLMISFRQSWQPIRTPKREGTGGGMNLAPTRERGN